MQLQHHPSFMRQSGFTLVELAIVLVIIGLIVGGVLTGQNLIKAAEINNTITRLGTYNAAATTFRAKYGALPGDISTTRASRFGMTPRSGTTGQGDGNDLIEGCARREAALGCETALFWIDLTKAQMISEAFAIGTSIADGNSVAASVSGADSLKNYVPSSAIRDTSYIHAMPVLDRNYFLIADFSTDASGDITLNSNKALTPSEGAQLDNKIDDGDPTDGSVIAIMAIDATGGGTTTDTGNDPPTATDCVNASLTPSAYNTANQDFAVGLTCNIIVQTSF